MPLSETHPSVVKAIEDVHKALDRRLVRGALILAKENSVGLRITLKVAPNGSVKVGVSAEDGNGNG